MRVVEHKMCKAVQSFRGMRCGNTEVKIVDGKAAVYLHGNFIAEYSQAGLFIQDCGWQTTTTKSRLNALLRMVGGGRISQTKFQWYINDKKWHGSDLIGGMSL